MPEQQPMTLTARTIAFGAFFGTLGLALVELGLHAFFTYMSFDDGGAVRELLTVTVGSVTTAVGIVIGALFGTRTPA